MAIAQVVFRQLSMRDIPTGATLPAERPAPALETAEWLSSINQWLPASWCHNITTAKKACRSDDAAIELAPWRRRIELPLEVTLSDGHWAALDEIIMRRYFRCLFRSLTRYLKYKYGDWASALARAPKRRKLRGKGFSFSLPELRQEIEAGRRVLAQNFGIFWQSDTHRQTIFRGGLWESASPSSWDWTLGSAIVFWRGSDAHQRLVGREGLPAFLVRPLPTSAGETRPRVLPRLQPLVYGKLTKVLTRKYLMFGPVKHCLHYFPVPKGPDDVRMVYDGTRGGLNDAQWAPSFYLPDIAAVTWFLDFDSFMFDLDYGECFLNFRQSPELRPYSGVSLRPFVKELKRDFPDLMMSGTHSPWVRWDRMFMGGKFSPYAVIKQLHWLEEAACGDPSDPKNPYRYDKVILNLPGSTEFDPSRSSVIKWDSIDECVACSVVTYSDDGRGAGSSANKAFLARDKLAKGIQNRGAQDAARKASFPSKTPPAWIGGCVNVTRDTITVSVPQEKWDKLKAHIQFYVDAIQSAGDDRPILDYKPLEKKLGFLAHVALTYRDFRPFLRGLYLTLNSWRPGFVDWAVNDDIDLDENAGEDYARQVAQEDPGSDPVYAPPSGQVRAARRFAADIKALALLTSRDTPTIRQVRHRKARLLFYAFTDASGTGGGASFVKAYHGNNLSYRVSVWTAEEQKESSNWREFTKVVDAVEDEARLGELRDSLVFLFTDNSTVEAAIHSGSSKSPRLHALVVRFLTLQMQFNFSIEVYHVAGTRMIAQGTDGISRGALNEGVMDGKPMISFIPLHLCPLARSVALKPWLLGWLPGSPIFLEPKDWFLRGHGITGFTLNTDGVKTPTFAQSSVLVWTPPPYAADIAIAELRKSVHKRSNHTHVFICPRLCLPKWRRHFHRACDVVLDIPAGSPGWPSEMFEPLLIGVIFPFIRHPPWQLRGTPRMFELERNVRRLCKDDRVDPSTVLREFCASCLRLQHMPAVVVRRMLYFESDA